MPNTYTLIASNTLSSSAASITFSAIPNTYTDLVIKLTARSNGSLVREPLTVKINNITTNYSLTYVAGDGSTVYSVRNSAQSSWNSIFDSNGANSTSNTFSNTDLYLPSYTSSNKKLMSNFGTSETNAAGGSVFIGAGACLVDTTETISNIVIGLTTAASFVSGSSFFLYGIKNS